MWGEITNRNLLDDPLAGHVESEMLDITDEVMAQVGPHVQEVHRTEVTPELAATGLANDVVRVVQQARRDADPNDPSDDAGELLTVTVSDDGVGLPEGFTPQGDSLGTQIVSSLVQDLRGHIRWERREPRGTTVTFTAKLRPEGKPTDDLV